MIFLTPFVLVCYLRILSWFARPATETKKFSRSSPHSSNQGQKAGLRKQLPIEGKQVYRWF
jgi:hypothetical protein